MVRIETSRSFQVEREVGFDYITDPTNWPQFWADLVEIPDLGRARWQEPGDTMWLRMRLAGRLTDLHMTLDELSRPTLVRYHTVQQGMPDTAHERYFEPADGGFKYRLVICFAPRAGLAGLFDRTLLRYAATRALRRTLDNLARQLPALPTRRSA
jgi:Polyketide cyclase / dehydrase and lipid transport